MQRRHTGAGRAGCGAKPSCPAESTAGPSCGGGQCGAGLSSTHQLPARPAAVAVKRLAGAAGGRRCVGLGNRRGGGLLAASRHQHCAGSEVHCCNCWRGGGACRGPAAAAALLLLLGLRLALLLRGGGRRCRGRVVAVAGCRQGRRRPAAGNKVGAAARRGELAVQHVSHKIGGGLGAS